VRVARRRSRHANGRLRCWLGYRTSVAVCLPRIADQHAGGACVPQDHCDRERLKNSCANQHVLSLLVRVYVVENVEAGDLWASDHFNAMCTGTFPPPGNETPSKRQIPHKTSQRSVHHERKNQPPQNLQHKTDSSGPHRAD
jgi:hypothetical protein